MILGERVLSLSLAPHRKGLLTWGGVDGEGLGAAKRVKASAPSFLPFCPAFSGPGACPPASGWQVLVSLLGAG